MDIKYKVEFYCFLLAYCEIKSGWVNSIQGQSDYSVGHLLDFFSQLTLSSALS